MARRTKYDQTLALLVQDYIAHGMPHATAIKTATKKLGDYLRFPGNKQHSWNGMHAVCSCKHADCRVCAAIEKRKIRGLKHQLNDLKAKRAA